MVAIGGAFTTGNLSGRQKAAIVIHIFNLIFRSLRASFIYSEGEVPASLVILNVALEVS